jgi:Dolichyl-phosphate-mannose-protein mannosyltransferase
MRQCCKSSIHELRAGLLLATVAIVSTGLNANLWSVPRFDGAGYAVLGRALTTGRGYREINKQNAPRHDHFPPGYPLALAALWKVTGQSIVAAHLLSEMCTVLAVLLAWRWFRAIYAPAPALALGLALAVNWSWGRIGGSIQSEPVYILWQLTTILIASRVVFCRTLILGIMLGLALAASILTRHVGGCLAISVGLALALRKQWITLITMALTAGVLILPWILWLGAVRNHSQLSLLTGDGLGTRVSKQFVFYVQRFADQITGPFVEVATVIRPSWILSGIANLWATIASAMLMWGWIQTIRSARRDLAGLTGVTTLALLLVWPFTEAGRFLIPLVPMLLVGFTEGLARFIRLASIKRPRTWAARVLLSVSIPYAVYSILGDRAEAQLRRHADFDAACTWITNYASTPGSVLTRHPGEVYWQTGHLSIEPNSSGPDAINRLIDQVGIAYILVDDERYINAEANPLKEYVGRYPDRLVLVWSESHSAMPVQVFKIVQSD